MTLIRTVIFHVFSRPKFYCSIRVQRGQFTGGDRFVGEVARKIGRRVERRGQGRPLKKYTCPLFTVGSGLFYRCGDRPSTLVESGQKAEVKELSERWSF